jgi:type II secretory pathway component PulK
MAVTLIALVAVALAGLTARVSTTARQAAQSRDRAQAEELILAGLTAIKQNPAARAIELPPTLRDAGAMVKLTPHDGHLRIEATVGRTHVTQEVEITGNAVKLLTPREE